jgi:hypothetical protein
MLIGMAKSVLSASGSILSSVLSRARRSLPADTGGITRYGIRRSIRCLE